MAKKKELTPTEGLAQLLVPKKEQLYEVPGNWQWVKLGATVCFERGITFPASAKRTEPANNLIPCLRTANVQDELELDDLIYIDKGFIKENAEKLTRKDDIIMSSANSRELVGKTSYVKTLPFPMTFGGFVLTIRAINVFSRYLFYFLRFEFLQGHFMGESTQTTNIANINTTKLSNYAFPFPPIPEQHRIVDRIESLFAKLDEAKEKAQAVVDGYEDRKAAILHQAFTGELTAEWRKKNNIPEGNWQEVPLQAVCYSIYDGDHMPPPQAEDGVPFLVISNVNTGHLSFQKTRYVSTEYYDTLSETRKPALGDVLYTLVGSYGIPVVVDDERPFCFQRHMALLKPSKVDTMFLWFQLQTKEFFNKATEIATGTAQLTVPIKGLRQLTIALPSDGEQLRIATVLEELLSKEDQALEVANNIISQMDTMKKAILARAFRGELGTNDPSEPPADIGIS